MSVSLKYDLTEYRTAVKNISQLKNDIITSRDKMKSGLEQIRQDWTTDGGAEFFTSIDSDWEDAIQNCLDVMEDLLSALDDAYAKYEGIEEEAENYLKI